MRDLLARKDFVEMQRLEELIRENRDLLRAEVVEEITHRDKTYPLYAISVGSEDLTHPVLGYFGGVHGLENIGSEVVLSYLASVLKLMRWDESFKERLKRSRLLFMPIVNPVGIVQRTRANGNGVDLMRNSALDGEADQRLLYRGHRLSPHLPWYRGEGGEMEAEARALCRVVEEKMFPASISLAIDVHSGFGAKDRLWFPYAHSQRPYPFLAESFALKNLYDQSYPHHFYEIEPVSSQYTIHGDLWDFLFFTKHPREIPTDPAGSLFIPWTLEMGSWVWVKKNPLQIFSKSGVFHPIKPHRYYRILRRHLGLFDFLHRSLLSPQSWRVLDESRKQKYFQQGLELWYKNKNAASR